MKIIANPNHKIVFKLILTTFGNNPSNITTFLTEIGYYNSLTPKIYNFLKEKNKSQLYEVCKILKTYENKTKN